MSRYLLAPIQGAWRPLPVSERGARCVAEHHRADWPAARPLDMVLLTEIQRQVYDYVREHQRMWGETPLYREIARACGLRGESSVQYQIAQLVKLGLIRKPRGLVRAIVITAVPVKPD